MHPPDWGCFGDERAARLPQAAMRARRRAAAGETTPCACVPPLVPVWQDGALLCQGSEELSWVLNMPAASLPAGGAGHQLPSALRESKTPPGRALSSCQGSPCSLPLVLLLSTCRDRDGRVGGFSGTDGAGQGAPSILLHPPRVGWPLGVKCDKCHPAGVFST